MKLTEEDTKMEKTMAGKVMEGGQASGETQNKLNRYALGCVIVASIVSIIFGYGKFWFSSFFLVKNTKRGNV